MESCISKKVLFKKRSLLVSNLKFEFKKVIFETTCLEHNKLLFKHLIIAYVLRMESDILKLHKVADELDAELSLLEKKDHRLLLGVHSAVCFD